MRRREKQKRRNEFVYGQDLKKHEILGTGVSLSVDVGSEALGVMIVTPGGSFAHWTRDLWLKSPNDS